MIAGGQNQLRHLVRTTRCQHGPPGAVPDEPDIASAHCLPHGATRRRELLESRQPVSLAGCKSDLPTMWGTRQTAASEALERTLLGEGNQVQLAKNVPKP